MVENVLQTSAMGLVRSSLRGFLLTKVSTTLSMHLQLYVLVLELEQKGIQPAPTHLVSSVSFDKFDNRVSSLH